MLCPKPAATATTPVNPFTGTAVLRFAVEPSPNWPPRFAPQAQTVPSTFRAMLWWLPAATATTPVNPLT
jgi:hypothetical protein